VCAGWRPSAAGQYLPVEVAIQFQYAKRYLVQLNVRLSASKLKPTLPCLGHNR